MELPDTTSGVPLVLVHSIKIRPGGNLEVPLECTRQLTDQTDIRIDTGFHHKNPNIYIPLSCINNPNNKYNPRYMPLTIFNLSTVDHLYIGKDTVITFAEQPVLETYNIELASEDKIKEHLAKPQNWVPQRHETLPEIPHDTAFLCSLADVPGPRKVQLQDKDIATDIRQKFEELCEEYGEAFSKNNEDIGRTKLVKMDIDAGDSPPVSSRPYTLPLKHYEWVQREIESLERAGVITKSMSKWASPIVIVPKKSAPREPPKRRLCVDFRKVNELQQEVITAGKTKGQISIHSLPKINEMYAKLKGAKVFSTIDLRSGYHHIALGKSLRAKTTFVTPFGKYEFLMVPFGLAQAPAYFQLLMNKVLKGLKFTMMYLDDFIIFSQDELQHLEHLEIVFSHLQEAGLKMKCSLADVPGPRKVQLQDKDITTDIRQKFEELCEEYGEAFSKNNEDIGRTKLVKMDIDAGDSPPVSSRPYTLPLKHYEWVQREIESLERAGVITKSMSKWASSIVIVPKKSAPGEPPKRRLCVDFRKVNELQQEVITAGKTKGQISIHSLPKINEMYAKLKGAKVFSTIDLRSGYHHIALGKSLRAKTTFVTPFGKYEFLMVPFGLAQAPAYFQLLMNKVLKGLKFTMMYLDDFIIFSQDELQHLEHLEIVFSCLWEAGLKMKCSKCDFFKSEINYLGHLISPEGINPLPNKLDSIRHMPVPNSAKEIKQFLGLTGYYRKFVPRFADISRPLTTLMKKDVKFKWTSACQKSFELLKEALCGEPVLKYADTSEPYTLYTDASKYGWAGVLTQPHTSTIDGKSTTTDHPVAFVSGLFRGSQLNWAALTKEAFAIYMSIKKLSFYLTDAQILLRSDHKPLEKFLLKNMLNSKVNNWAMEFEAFNIQFDYIKGSNNILVDTLSRLIAIDPDTPTTPEEPGYEFGYAIFEEFPKVQSKTYEVNEVIVDTDTEIIKNDPELQNSLQYIQNPIAPQRLKKLQQQDPNIEILKRKLQRNRLDEEYYSLDENELLTRKVIDGGHEFNAIYLPSALIFQVLRTAHDDLGHNGFPRTYAALKRVFFWKGMKEDIRKHCKTCATCQLHKLENVKFERKIFKPSLQLMDFICMDLIGEFYPPTSRGHRYALTAVCMLTGFTWCVPLKTKTAEEVAKAYMDHIYCNFGGSIKILTDNGTEFKNKLFKEVVNKLGMEFSIHSPPYRQQSNGKIEGFHRFLKTCIGKHINYGLEWDELTPMATACYNFFPNCSARESAFFVMFERDPINKLNMLLHAARHYFHDGNGLPNLEALKNIYQVVAQQLLNSRTYVKKHHNQQ